MFYIIIHNAHGSCIFKTVLPIHGYRAVDVLPMLNLPGDFEPVRHCVRIISNDTEKEKKENKMKERK